MQLKDPNEEGTRNAGQSQLVFLIKANKQQNDHKSFEDAIARALHSVCNIKAGSEKGGRETQTQKSSRESQVNSTSKAATQCLPVGRPRKMRKIQ